MLRALVILAFATTIVHADAQADVEVETPKKLDLPALPSFDGEAGVRHISELRAKRPNGAVKVKGFVVWVYDCVTAISRPRDSKQLTLQRIEDTPSLCKEPHFALGAVPNEMAAKSLWIVGVPRELTKRERMTLAMETIRDWPKVPKLEVGDLIAVEGTLNADGKLVYAAFTKAIELRHIEARYRRGLVYWRKRQFERAKGDLKLFALTTKDDIAKHHAHRLLDELAGINK